MRRPAITWPVLLSSCAAMIWWCAAALLMVASVASADELSDRLEPLVTQHRGKVAVAVKHLGHGAEYSYRADAVMPTASLIKFPVMVTAYRLANDGKLDLNKMLTLRAADKVPGSGILTTHFSPGAQISVRDAIRLMIAYSDNTATNLLLDEIGLPTTADMMTALGCPDTKIHAKVFRGDTSIFPERSKQYGLGSTTPRQMIRLLEALHRRELASGESCEQMLEHLLACEDKKKLVRELPAGTKVAHKSGSVNAVRTDAGLIMTPGGPIAICVMTADNEDKRWTDDNEAEILCGRIARVVLEHFRPDRTPADAAPRTLAVGASGPLVEALQRTLNARLSPSPELAVDGDFGQMTRDAVTRFQRERQIATSGIVDAATWKALGPLLTEPDPVPAPQVVNSQVLPRQAAEDLTDPPLVTAKAFAIADAKSGVLLWGKAERQRLHIASTTKMMTAYLVLRLAKKDPSVLDEIVTFSRRADNTGGTTCEIRAGEMLPVGELLYGLLLPSGNDASVALAEHFGSRVAIDKPTSPANGNRSGEDPLQLFVREMNRTAQALGMHDTQYRNPHGLTHPEHLSTAADLVRLALACRQLPKMRHYVNTRQHGYTVASTAGYTRNILWKNTNKLLELDGYAGIKTGTTQAAGACLVSLGRRGDDELIVVVLGSANSDARYTDTRNLFRWAWQQR